MNTQQRSLGTELPKEIKRCEELLVAYAGIGPAGAFGLAVIKAKLAEAHRATAEQDVVAMLRAYEALRECK